MSMGSMVTGGMGMAANIAGALAGSAASSGDIAAATNAVDQAYARLSAIGLPPNIAQPIIYNQFKQAGILTPELEQNINQHPSLMAGVQGSQPAQQAQLQALQILQQTGQTGMTPQSAAALAQIRQQVAADTNSKQQAIQQQFAAQGQGGSGAQLIGELQNAQSGANQESTAGNQVGAMAAQNALQAIGQAGTLGSQIQQQQFGEQAQKAQAQDIINQFNTANQLGVQQQNTQAQNKAQAYNLGQAQQLSNANTQQANQELLRQNQAQNQMYEEGLNTAQIQDQAALGYSKAMNNYGSMAGQAAAAPYQAIGAGLTSLSGYMGSPSTSASTNEFGNTTGSVANGVTNSGQSSGAYGGYGLTAYKGAVLPMNEGGDVDDYQGGKYTDFRSGTSIVPGKAKMPGDHPANDTVKAMLSPGEMVVPRTLAKTNFGKKLAKLLELHHEVMDHQKNGDLNNE